MPTKNGPSQREALEKIWKSTGKKPKPLEDLPEVPPVMLPVYNKYLQLRRGKVVYDSLLTWVDIRNWKLVMDATVTTMEVQYMFLFDAAFVQTVNTERMKMQK